LNLFNLWQNVFTTFIMTMYIMTLGIMGGYVYVLGFPVIMIILDYIIIYMYAGPQADKYEAFMTAERDWKDSVVSLCDMRPLITTYRKSKDMAMEFKAIHQKTNKEFFATASFQNSVTRTAKQIHAVLAMCAYIVTGYLVCKHHMKVGAFVTIMMTIWKFDAQVLHLFVTVFDMSNGYAAIKQMAQLLNADTRRQGILAAQQRRGRLMAELERNDPNFTRDNIILYKAAVVYDANTDHQRMIGPVSMSVEQGMLIAITAGHNAGKTTFLKLLGNMVIPDQGFVWYPPNLRNRYITETPLLISGSLIQNLRWGNKVEHTDEDILGLCKALGMNSNLIGKPDMDVGLNGQRLALSQRVLVCIARALLSSVDLLLLCNSLDNMPVDQANHVMGVLRTMVENKGLKCLSHERRVDISLKKKKTIFLITNNPEIEMLADARICCDGAQTHGQSEASMVWFDQTDYGKLKEVEKAGTTTFAKRSGDGGFTVFI